MIWHSNDIESVLKELDTDISTGLTSEKARMRFEKIKSKIKQHEEKKSFLSYLGDEIKSHGYTVIMVLSVVAFAFYFIFHTLSLFEPIALFLLAILKALLTAFVKMHYYYEIDRGKTAEKSTVKVLRDGEAISVDSEMIVPGDIIFVSAGDYIPADARLIKESDLHCDEYNVTGETVPTQKNANALLQDITPVVERSNMIFAGSHVLSGSGVAVVTEILDYTEYSKKVAIEKENNPFSLSLEQRLFQLSRLLNIALSVVCAVLFITAFIASLVTGTHQFAFLNSVLHSALLASAIALAFMPASIGILATACVSRGIRRMKAKGISLFNPKSIDSIAKLDVICADKTGTFTQNKMVLTQMFDGQSLINVKKDLVDGSFKMLLRIAALCCDGEVKLVKGIPVESGDATQTAVIAASMEHLGLGKYELDNIYPRMAEIPFDPDRKLMTTVNIIDGKTYAIVRGSVEVLSTICEGDCSHILEAANDMSGNNLRVVGVAMKPIEDYSADLSHEEIECDLNFIGILGLADMPRLDSKASVKACKNAGMKVVMITGDHPSAALATAQKLRIAKSEEQVITGAELANLSEDELCNSIEKYTVFARVTAEDRCRIVKAFKDNGHFVATTGDSASNTASMRSADIGYSMGKSGSDVAICSSEVVIDDDSFSSVVVSVKDCRGIYHNISKSIKFFLSAAVGIILSTFIGIIIFGSSPLTAGETVVMSLFSILLMSLGMAYEPSEEDAINIIVDNDAGIFKLSYLIDILFNSAIYAISCLVTYAIGASIPQIASTSSFTFVTVFLTFLLSGLTLKTNKSLLNLNLENPRSYIFAAAAFVVLLIINIAAPGTFTPFGILYWLYALIVAAVTTVFLNIIKVIRRNQ